MTPFFVSHNAADLNSMAPGDDVAVIGHPQGFLWSLTRGIVSGIRKRYPMGNTLGTVIQTQAPIAPGSSGGPLLTPSGLLMGVIVWKLKTTQGLNGAIGINEILSYISNPAKRLQD